MPITTDAGLDLTRASFDFSGTLVIKDMARLLRLSPDTIRRAVKRGTFPVRPLRGTRYRWSGPSVKRWYESDLVVAVPRPKLKPRRGRP